MNHIDFTKITIKYVIVWSVVKGFVYYELTKV